MLATTFDIKDFKRVMNNVVAYSSGFITEVEDKKHFITRKVANASIAEFYRYLDSLANTNPSMLHHVYEWGATGNKSQRLYELKAIISGNRSRIEAEFLTSDSIADGSSEPFYEKAKIMEEGIPVVVNEINAKALFFEIDGQEFFRTGPIVIENPGGAEVRGQFVSQFEEFYNVYLTQFYLKSIKFYDHFSNAKAYTDNFSSISKKGNAYTVGQQAALKWIMTAPGDE